MPSFNIRILKEHRTPGSRDLHVSAPSKISMEENVSHLDKERISNLCLRVGTWFQTQHAETHYEKEPHDSERRVSEFTT